MVEETSKIEVVDNDARDRYEAMSAAFIAGAKSVESSLMRTVGRSNNASVALRFGKDLRDSKMWDYPFVGPAVSVWQQLAAGREVILSGAPRATSRAIKFLQNAEVWDRTTGLVQRGHQSFLQRRALDYTTVGRTAFAVAPTSTSRGEPVLQYIDPCALKLNTQNMRGKMRISDEEFCWLYGSDVEFRAREVHLDHPIPVGTNGFISPLAPLVPTAVLAWLLTEHKTASLDGRKIRDILFVANSAVKGALENAIGKVAALWAGEDVSKVGLPVVELNMPAGAKASDLYALLGLSRMPENFKEEEFWFMYVNMISACLSLALRHFWNSERSTNKALEEVQERRGQNKGPASFVRSEQRQMNMPGVLDHLGKVRMGFLEEVDSSARLDNAEILSKTTAALASVAKVFGATISLDSYLAWMQSIGVLPNEMELVQSASVSKLTNTEDIGTADPNNTTVEAEPAPTALPEKTAKAADPYELDYDEITVDLNGNVVNRRLKLFTLPKVLAAEIEAAPVPTDVAVAIAAAVDDKNQTARDRLKTVLPLLAASVIDEWRISKGYAPDTVLTALSALNDDKELTEIDQLIVDGLVDRFANG
jgi:hypothetical protein